MVDLTRTPILYTPSGESNNTNTALSPFLGPNGSPSLNILKSSNGGDGTGTGGGGGVQTVLSETRRRKPFPPPETRMVVYVRQENEEIYTPLHLVPPTVPGLARAIETKYNVSATAIRLDHLSHSNWNLYSYIWYLCPIRKALISVSSIARPLSINNKSCVLVFNIKQKPTGLQSRVFFDLRGDF